MKRFQLTVLAAAIGLTGAAHAQVQNSTTNYVYDTMGNLKQVTDPLNQITKHDYDALNRRIKTTDAKNGITQFGYDGQDQLNKVTDARNLITNYTIDGLGNLSKTTSPDTGITNRTFDEASNLKTSTDAKNQVTTYQYDALNRVTSVAYGDGSSATYAYDQGTNGLGRLTQVTDISGVTQYVYDQQGHVTQETRTIGGQAYVTAYRYDDAGRLTGLTYPSGRSVDYTRDGMGRISSVGTTKDGITTALATDVQYQPFGALKSLTFGNGQTYSRTYDLDGRMASFTLNGVVQTVSYDAASRLTGIADAGNANNSRTYGYDQLDRLTSEQYPTTSRGYAYDAVGNRTQSTVNAVATNNTYAATSNRLATAGGSTITMDANGSTTNNGVGSQFGYDARGRMVSANTAIGQVTYQINALGQRVLKTTPTGSTVFHYAGDGKLIAENRDGAAMEYVWLGDAPVAVLSGSDAYYIHIDQINTPRAIADQNQVAVWRWDSDGFASIPPNEQIGGTSPFVFNLRFAGQYFDREANLYYNYFRDYDPQTGRYIQSDPIGLDGGINTYTYVESNPLIFVDPNGLEKLVLVDPKDSPLIYHASKNDPDIPGTLTIYAHGAPKSIADDRLGRKNRIRYGASGMSKIIKDSGLWKPRMPIILKSCETGQGDDSIGENIGKNLGTSVTAPNTTYFFGDKSIGPYERNWLGGPDFSSPGKMVTFPVGR